MRFTSTLGLTTDLSGALFGATFDTGGLAVTGPTVTLATDVGANGGFYLVAVSETGSLVYAPPIRRDLVVLDPTGNRRIVSRDRRFHNPRFSPDGRHISMDLLDAGSREVWSLDLQQETLSRVTTGGDRINVRH